MSSALRVAGSVLLCCVVGLLGRLTVAAHAGPTSAARGPFGQVKGTSVPGSVIVKQAPGSGQSEAGARPDSIGAPQPPPPAPPILLTSPFPRSASLSAEQLDIDARSRTAFTHLDRSAAVALAERTFDIEQPSWAPPGSEAGTRVARYLSTYTASEERPGGKHVLVQSTIPLQTEDAAGHMAPVSVTLHDDGSAYTPENPLVPFSIAKSATASVAFASGVSVSPTSAAAPEPPALVGNQVIFANTAKDTDFMVEPLAGGTGADLSWQLRSQASSTENALSFKLPLGGVLRMSPITSGAVEVIQGSQTLLVIPPASAHGADGSTLPVTYTVSGHTLTTHVSLNSNVDFPVLVDPEVFGYYGLANGGNGWANWHNWQACGCFGFEEEPTRIAVVAQNLGPSQGAFADWYTGSGNTQAQIMRVDVGGAYHTGVANATLFQARIYPENGEVYTYNGTDPKETRPSPLNTGEVFGGRAIAFCAHGAGGADGSSQPLCNEKEGGDGFDFYLETNSPQNAIPPASSGIETATVRYIQTTGPSASMSGPELTRGWRSFTTEPWVTVNTEDGGTGVSAFGVDAVKGIASSGTWNPPYGSAPVPGTTTASPACGDPFCPYTAWSNFNLSALPTGIWTLGAWARDPVENENITTYTAYVDKTPPEITAPSWQGQTFSDGPHVLGFSAQDGSEAAPQSGVGSIEVLVDGQPADEDVTTCPKPEGTPSANCFAFSGSWTLQAEDYGAGPHTVTLRATDWAGNVSERNLQITINHPVDESQQVGPGTLDLLSGNYKLGSTDISVPAGATDLAISRTYNSGSNSPGPLGPGWLLSTPDTSADGQWQSLQPTPQGVEATTTSGQKVTFTATAKGYTSATGFQNFTLTEPETSPATYQISDSGGDYTQFTEPAGASSFIPTTVAQANGAEGLNRVTYGLTEGKTTEILGPVPTETKCPIEPLHPAQHLQRGCRALTLTYAKETKAKGENESEWGEYEGRLTRVTFTAYNPSTTKVEETAVAEYTYDKQGRLRAEWDPRVEPALKTVYGYDPEGHLTSLTPPGEQSWVLHYGTINGDSEPDHLVSMSRPSASTPLWNGEVLTNKTVPVISGSAMAGIKLGSTNGTWSSATGAAPVAYGYQWESCNSSGGECAALPGATNPTYTPQSSEVGHTVVLQVTATNGGGSVVASSGPSAVVAASQLGATLQSEFGTGGSYNPTTKLYCTGQFCWPRGAAIDSKGHLWVADTGHSELKELSESGQELGHFGSFGSGEKQFEWPTGVAVDSKGNVWVSDCGDGRVDKYKSENGEYEGQVGSGKLGCVNGIAVAKGDVWVIAGSQVKELSESGKEELHFGSEGSHGGQLREPAGLALDGKGNVWVADSGNNRVEEFSESGAYERTVGAYGSGNGQLDAPLGVTVAPDGALWVSDSYNRRIEEFNGEGEYIRQFAASGAGTSGTPAEIAFDSKGDAWVVDIANSCVEEWHVGEIVSGSNGETEPAGARSTIEYHVPVSGEGAPNQLGASEVAAWSEKEAPAEATAIFPPDEPQGWPASEYKRATLYYFDSAGRLVNTAAPGGAIFTTEYDSYDNVARTLTPGNRQRALEAGSGSAAESKLLDTKSSYTENGTELESSTGPQHEVKLANGQTVQARAHTKYYYDENAPAAESYPGYVGGVYNVAEVPQRLVTKTTEGAELEGGGEEEVRTVRTLYSGQEGLGWKLHKPTSVTVEPETGQTSTRTTVYNPLTGDVVESKAPRPGPGPESAPGYVSQFGSAGQAEGQFHSATGVATDSAGDLWVGDYGNNRVEEFTPEGVPKASYGTSGSGTAKLEFEGVAGIAINQSTGNVYVADVRGNRIEELSSKGSFIRAFGKYGEGPGEFNTPLGLAVEPSTGNLWVADEGNDRVQEFSPEGTFKAAYGSYGSEPLHFKAPTGVALSGGHLYITDSGNDRVQQISSSGAYEGEFGSKGGTYGELELPAAIATDSTSGDLYVVDSGNTRVERFSPSGEFLTAFGAKGGGPGQFESPEGLTVGASGAVYVTDGDSDHVEKWTPQNSAVSDSQAIYYSEEANSSYPACGNHPEWAGLPCETQPTKQPEDNLPKLPITTTTYNMWDEPGTTTQTVGSKTRSTTVVYDGADRVLTTSMSSSTGQALPTVTDEYSKAKGLLIKESTPTETLHSAFDTLGELESYTDASGSTSTFTYDEDGRLKTAYDGDGTQTYSYDPLTGELTGLHDSGAGAFTASYNEEGELQSEVYPNGMSATYTHNSIDETTALSYIKGSAVWYTDQVAPSIHGQWLAQQSSLSGETYAYDGLGRLTEVTETPQGKGCTTSLFAYDENSDRIGETTRQPTGEGKCASEGGATTAHSYDAADRLTDPGTEYETFGGATTVPAGDAGGHALESTYYASGAPYTQTQNGQSHSYQLDPLGRVQETTTVIGLESNATIFHYSGNDTSPAWTSTNGSATRNIVGIGGDLVATQTGGSEAVIQLSNLHGDVIGTVADNAVATKPTLTSEATAFGVPTSSTPSKYSWLGSGALQTEFPSGVARSGEGVYIPQLGLDLGTETLDGAASQDPVNEYLAGQGEAQPTGTRTATGPGAIEPLPVNAQEEREFWEHPPWNKPPVNAPVEQPANGPGEGPPTVVGQSPQPGSGGEPGGCSGVKACAAGNHEWVCTLAGTVVAAGVMALTAGITAGLAGGAFTAGCILGESSDRTYVSGLARPSGCFFVYTISKRTHLRDHRAEQCYA